MCQNAKVGLGLASLSSFQMSELKLRTSSVVYHNKEFEFALQFKAPNWIDATCL